jgi:hypothetical protein
LAAASVYGFFVEFIWLLQRNIEGYSPTAVDYVRFGLVLFGIALGPPAFLLVVWMNAHPWRVALALSWPLVVANALTTLTGCSLSSRCEGYEISGLVAGVLLPSMVVVALAGLARLPATLGRFLRQPAVVPSVRHGAPLTVPSEEAREEAPDIPQLPETGHVRHTEAVTEQDSPVILRPDPARLRLVLVMIGLAIPVVLVVWWPQLWPALRDMRERATDLRYVVTLLLLGGPPALWLVAYLVGSWLRVRLQVDAQSLHVTGAIGPTRTVARARLGSIVRCLVPSGFYGTPTPMAFLVDRSGRYVLQLSSVFDLDRVAALLAVPLAGSFNNRMTRAEVEARYGVARRSMKVFAAAVIGMVAYTVAAIAFIIYVL